MQRNKSTYTQAPAVQGIGIVLFIISMAIYGYLLSMPSNNVVLPYSREAHCQLRDENLYIISVTKDGTIDVNSNHIPSIQAPSILLPACYFSLYDKTANRARSLWLRQYSAILQHPTHICLYADARLPYTYIRQLCADAYAPRAKSGCYKTTWVINNRRMLY